MLNVLNGNYTPSYGKVSINGIDVHGGAEEIEGLIGYVAQDDLLIEELLCSKPVLQRQAVFR